MAQVSSGVLEVVGGEGASKDGQALAGSIATMTDCLIDMKVTSGIKFAKGIRNTSRLANGIDRVNDVIGKSQLANSGFITVKASNKYSKTKTGESLFDKVSKANTTQEKRNEIMDRYHEHH